MSTSLCSAVTYSTGLAECRERDREDISCIISCSSKRCLSDLVHDMPPCFSVSSFRLSVCLSFSLILFLSVCLSFYLFPTIFIPLLSYHPPTACSWQQRGHTAGPGGYIRSPFSPGDTPDAASPSTPIFDHTVKRECFLLLLDCAFKKPFLRPVCLRCTSDENSDPFFPTRSASSGIVTSPLPPFTHTHTHHTPTPSLQHQIFHFQGER